ncbi:MAG: tetratricopeptide repeat protein [Saprospiraceae bacterium]|nr:tetratricopeptide repeat protein [Saprospiraceae bacterium]MDW8483773.1 tetratricopeptide repeat protein [Saprospiraceae bacterium]
MSKARKAPPPKSTARKPTRSAPKGASGSSPVRDLLERPSVATPLDSRLRLWFWILAGAGLMLLCILAFGAGINADDKFQNAYSAKLINYYTTLGRDTSALNVPEGNMHLYGGFFELVTGFTNKALGFQEEDMGYHHVRHLFSAILGWVAILAAGLLARLIAGWPAGVLTLVLLLLSPRFVGDALVNPKDIPFAAGYMLTLYHMAALLQQMPRPSRWHWIGLVAGLAISLSVRAGGLLNFAYLFFFAALFFLLKHGRKGFFEVKLLRQYAVTVGSAAVVGYALALLFWPFALQAPLTHPWLALTKFSDLEIAIRVLYDGTNIKSNLTPWHYPIKWIALTIPVAVLVGFGGCFLLLPRLLRRYQPLWVVLVLFAAIFPIFYVIYKNATLHDGWRHLTFAYPPMAVAAGVFWSELFHIFSSKRIALLAIGTALTLLMADAIIFLARYPRISYLYFNPIAGGLKGAYGNYETDYWGISIRQGVEWLEKQGILRPNMEEVVVIATNMYYPAKQYLAKYGDKVLVKYLKWERRCDDAWDYALYPTRFINGHTLKRGLWPPDNAIHVIKVDGVPILAILKDTTRNCALGTAALKLQNWSGAIEHLQQEVKNVPDNELAWANLAQAYFNSGQLEQAKAAAEKALDISPADELANNILGLYWLNQGKAEQAKSQFLRTTQLEPGAPMPYYYLAVIAQRQGNLAEALKYLDKLLQLAPGFQAAYELGAQLYEALGNTQMAQQFREAAKQLQQQ